MVDEVGSAMKIGSDTLEVTRINTAVEHGEYDIVEMSVEERLR